MRRSSWSSIVFVILGGPLLLFLARCTGDDPKTTAGCTRDDQCGVGQRCDVAASTCVAAGPNDADASDGNVGGSDVIILGQPDEYSNVERELGLGGPVGVDIAPDGRLVAGDYQGFRA